MGKRSMEPQGAGHRNKRKKCLKGCPNEGYPNPCVKYCKQITVGYKFSKKETRYSNTASAVDFLKFMNIFAARDAVNTIILLVSVETMHALDAA